METYEKRLAEGKSFSPTYDWAGYTLGFALSGFFDGILLHQVLQWHHLLSALDTGRFGDMRMQVMADGLFHALMYLIAVVGLCLLLKARGDFRLGHAGRRLWANFWIGFGVWHVVDAVLSHWVTQIHRIRMDVPVPLIWDLGWLLFFGIIPLIVGLRMRRKGKPDSGGKGPSAVAAGLMISAVGVGSAVVNLYPLRSSPVDAVTVILRPDSSAADLFGALEGTEGRVLWHDRAGGIWVVAGASKADMLRFYRFGAMYVSGSTLPAGCAAWVLPPGARPSSASTI